MARFLLLFVDGVGLAPASDKNPLASEPMPALAALLGGPLTSERAGAGDGWTLAALDATLGVP
ncbi:MAG TPA: metalloenzyme, partial [Thermoanaerobaculia bacterium]|nr:metalloenzyme [Thermoanaerobaculia bacterium]